MNCLFIKLSLKVSLKCPNSLKFQYKLKRYEYLQLKNYTKIETTCIKKTKCRRKRIKKKHLIHTVCNLWETVSKSHCTPIHTKYTTAPISK